MKVFMHRPCPTIVVLGKVLWCVLSLVKSEITRPLHLCSLVFFQLNPEIVHHEGSAISNAVNGGCQGCIR